MCNNGGRLNCISLLLYVDELALANRGGFFVLLMKVSHLNKSFGSRNIVVDASMTVYSHDRIGIVGRNGQGKSTLLTMLAGELQADAGIIECYGKLAYIPQLDEWDQPIDYVTMKKWHAPPSDSIERSGGEITRTKIATAFSVGAHILIADEPTSHLDLYGIEQLTKELNVYQGAILVTSHDQQFLNALCTKIWEIEEGKVTVYEGNYDDYALQKQALLERKWKEFEAFRAEKYRLTEAAKELKQKSNGLKKTPSRMGNSEARLHKRSTGEIKAKLNRAVESIEMRIEKLEEKEKPKNEDRILFDASLVAKLHAKRVIQLHQYPLCIGDRVLKSEMTGELPTGSRLAITGPNGCGKSTLLQRISERDTKLDIAQTAKMGYFSQHQNNINPELSILSNISKESPYNETFIRIVLSRLAFKRDEVYKKGSMLSGGERMRASLAKVLLGNYQVLLLDEPTNYLDLHTRKSLLEVLKAFPGTIIFVAHDRSFIKELATHVLDFEEDQPRIRRIDDTPMIPPSEADHQEQCMLLDLEITQVLGLLSNLSSQGDKEQLEQRFQKLIERKRQLQK